MTQHTPGPWRVDFRPEAKADTLGRPLIVTKDGYQPIAGIYGKSPSSGANARLIAAAPDLLDKTQKLAIVAEALEGGESPGIFDWLKIRDEARAAIEKAEETPHEAP